MSDDLRPEYDMKALLKGGERGKYVERYKAVIELTKLPTVKKVRSTKP